MRADVCLTLEKELHCARLTIVQLEAQRDFLLLRLVEMEGEAWELPQDYTSPFLQQPQHQHIPSQAPRRSSHGVTPAGGSAKKRRQSVRSDVDATGERTGLCSASLKTGKLCRRKATTGFVYCGYHLPLDPNSGFMYCTHTRGGKKCGNPVPVQSDRLCKYHKSGSAFTDDRGSESQSDSD